MNKKHILYRIIAALLLAVVALVFFAPADFEGKVLQQADIRQGLANGQELKAFEEQTGEQAYWTNALFSGMPSFQISPSYEANKMLQWVVKVYTLWLPSPANLLFAMMLGFFIMCICMKMKWPMALFGAVAWGLSTYFIIIIGAGHIWKFLTLAYIPPTIGGIALAFRGRYAYGSAVTAIFTALQLGSNHPQMTYYFLFVIAALVIAWFVTAWNERAIRQWVVGALCLVGAGGLGVAANSASLYMSYEYSKETIRGHATDLTPKEEPGVRPGPKEGLDYDYITQWSYGIDETLTLLIPNAKGGASVKPVGGEMMPRSMLDTETFQNAYISPQEQQFAYYFMQYFGDQPMTNGPVYVGAFVLVLAVVALFICEGVVSSPTKWALLVVSVFSIILAWGSNFEVVTRFCINNIPFYNKFRTPSSALVVVEFAIPLLATMGIIRMLRTPSFLRRKGVLFFTVCGVAAFICLVGWLAPDWFGAPWSANEQAFLKENAIFGNPAYANVLRLIEESRLRAVSQDSLRSLAFILVGTLLCFIFLKGWVKNRPVFVCSLTALVLVDLFTVNRRYVDYDNFVAPVEEVTAFEPTQADLAILQDTTPNYRVLDVDHFSEARSSYFHKTIGGYHAAKLTRYNDLIDRQILQGNNDVINMLNARYIISGEKAIYNPEAFGNAWFVDRVNFVANPDAEMKALETTPLRSQAVADNKYRAIIGSSSPVSRGDTIYETSYAPGKVDYRAHTRAGGVAVFSEIFFPWGWVATIDGRPVEIGRVNYVLRAINVPAGTHHIRFEFRPRRLEAANVVGVIAVSLIYALCAFALILYIYRFFRPKVYK